MSKTKKDLETISASLSKSKTNDVSDMHTSEDKKSISQKEKNINDKDFYTFDERTEKELNWIWYPYILKGNINIIQGDGGLGKSFLTTWLVSAISVGKKIPFSEECFKIGTSILQNAEDDIDSTILPRLILNGADTSKIGYFNEDKKVFNIQQLDRLENKLKELKPEICVIDPAQAYIGNINMNSANEVREVLKPLKLLAQKYNCAFILIMHLNKNSGVKATQRNMGSVDFVSAARSVMMIAENPENDSERLFIPIKTNLMKDNEKNTLSFKINDGIVEWKENKGKVDADEVINFFETKDVLKSVAKGFIIGALSRGDIGAIEFKELVLNNGISEKMYNRTKAELNKENIIDSYQKDKKFYWTLINNKKEDRL